MRVNALRSLVFITAVAFAATVLAGDKLLTKTLKIRGTVFADITGVSPSSNGPAPVVSFTITGADGVMSHAGQYNLSGQGWMDLNNGMGADFGVFTAANGDLIPFDGYFGGGLLVVISRPGCTGRFEDGAGGFVAEMFNAQLDWETMKMSFQFVGTGEMTL
jgi:hypothetical protein